MKKYSFFSNVSLYLCFIFLVLFSYLIKSKLEHNFDDAIPFNNIDITHTTLRDLPIEDYIVRDQNVRERFLIAPNAPDEMGIRLVATASSKVILDVESIYTSKNCAPEQIGKAILRLYLDSAIDVNYVLTKDKKDQFVFDFFKGDRLYINFRAPGGSRCGKALLSFSKKNKIDNFSYGFLIFWSITALVFILFGVSTFYAGMGALFNTALIFANLTIGSAVLSALINTIFLSLAFVGLLMMIGGLPIWRILKMILASVFSVIVLSVPLAFIAHKNSFLVALGKNEVHAVMQSNLRQGIEFLVTHWQLSYTLYIVVFLLVLFLVIYTVYSPVFKKATTFIFGLFLFMISVVQWPTTLDKTPVLLIINEAVATYFHEFEIFREMSDQRQDILNQLGAETKATKQTLLVILGESASKHHMSSYGYFRKTTPYADSLIESGEMIRFDAVYSNHTLSNQTISRVLTSASNYNGGDWIRAPSVINLAETAGLKTAWVSNKPMYGAFDSHMSVIGTEAEDVTYINTRIGIRRTPNEHDGKMLPLMKEAVSKNDDNQLVFMHLQGSHTVYCQRIPDDFKSYSDEPQKYIFGDVADIISKRFWDINCYDDSIRYTDGIISDAIEFLRDNDEPSAMLYFPDHGENAIQNTGHNPSLFDFNMAEIPMFFWANEAWKQKNSEQWNELIKNKQKIFTNDHAFELISGLSGIESELVDEKNNLASAAYIEVSQPTTLHGSKKLDATNNLSFWQQKNITKLNASRLLKKVVALQSNTINKIGFMHSAGINSIEVDVIFDGKEYLVGADDKSMAEVNLDKFLSNIDLLSLENIWFNLHGINNANIVEAVTRFEYLDQSYTLKNKSKLLLDFDVGIAAFLKAGFMTIYNAATSDSSASQVLESGFNGSGVALNKTQYHALKDKLAEKQILINLRLEEDALFSSDLIKELEEIYFTDNNILSISIKTWSLYDL